MKKIFSFKMYKEGLNELKLISFIFLVLSVFVNALIKDEYMTSRNSLISINYMVFLSYTVIVPVMTLYLFMFMTKRNSSDFYDALPHSRVCIYISYCASIVTSIASIIFISSVVGYICKFLTGYSFKMFSFGDAFVSAIGFFVCCLLVMVSINIAQMITGTLFTNVVVSGIIIFFPRIFISVIIMIIESVCPYLDTTHMFSLFNNRYNLVTSSVASTITTDGLLSVYEYVPGMIYTFVLALIYFCIAIYMCGRRKSEAAGLAAPTRSLQAVIRCTISMMICLPSINGIIAMKYIPGSESYSRFIILFYGLAVFSYFVYEIISTKKVDRVIKIAPGLLVVVALNIGVIGVVAGVKQYTGNIEIDKNSVKYFTIDEWNDDTFRNMLLCEYKINDEQLIDWMISEYDASMEKMKRSDYADYELYRVAIHTKKGTYYRKIRISTSFFAKCYQYISSQKDFMEKAVSLPDKKDVLYYGYDVCEDEDKYKEIYDCYRNELSTFDLEKQYRILYDESEERYDLKSFGITYEYKGELCYREIRINNDTPATYNKYLEYMYEQSQDYIKKNSNIIVSYDTFELSPLGEHGGVHYYSGKEEEETRNKMVKLIDEYSKELINCTELPTIDTKTLYINYDSEAYIFVPSEKMQSIIEEMRDLLIGD